MKCLVCNRTLKSRSAIAAGIGPTCRKRSGSSASGSFVNPNRVKAFFLSRRAQGYRSFAVKDSRIGKGYTVRIYGPDSDGRRTADCSCGAGEKCDHVIAAAALDERSNYFMNARIV